MSDLGDALSGINEFFSNRLDEHKAARTRVVVAAVNFRVTPTQECADELAEATDEFMELLMSFNDETPESDC